jgi:hypothetical protein
MPKHTQQLAQGIAPNWGGGAWFGKTEIISIMDFRYKCPVPMCKAMLQNAMHGPTAPQMFGLLLVPLVIKAARYPELQLHPGKDIVYGAFHLRKKFVNDDHHKWTPDDYVTRIRLFCQLKSSQLMPTTTTTTESISGQPTRLFPENWWWFADDAELAVNVTNNHPKINIVESRAN